MTSPQKSTNEFDAKASFWDEDFHRRALTAAIAKALMACVSLRSGQRLLEYGCGTASLSFLLADRVGSIDAVDVSMGMLEQVRKKLMAAGIRNIHPLLLDLTRDPPPSDPYDGIIIAMALHHIADIAALLRTFVAMLRPGGFLAMADLLEEDGSFHGDVVVPHPGLQPEVLMKLARAQELTDVQWRVVHHMARNDREYPVFLLCARKPKLKVLFLCTGNSCRSQMAEGWARALKSDMIEAHSAGVETHGLNPLAVKVMAEVGVDISHHRSKKVDDLQDKNFDYVVTVCSHAHETCPMWLKGNAKVVHVGFDDPPTLAKGAKTEEEALSHYRRVRDEIRRFLETLPDSLKKAQTTHEYEPSA